MPAILLYNLPMLYIDEAINNMKACKAVSADIPYKYCIEKLNKLTSVELVYDKDVKCYFFKS